jgi:hypothetical protein
MSNSGKSGRCSGSEKHGKRDESSKGGGGTAKTTHSDKGAEVVRSPNVPFTDEQRRIWVQMGKPFAFRLD